VPGGPIVRIAIRRREVAAHGSQLKCIALGCPTLRTMPSAIGHAAFGLSVGGIVFPRPIPKRSWILTGLAIALLDLDAVGRPFGNLALEDAFGGHRGLTHSMPFAFVIAALLVFSSFPGREWAGTRLRLWLCVALAVGSHGLLDTLTGYGQGVALLAPLSWHRFKSPWTPIGPLTGPACRGVIQCSIRGIANELTWVGLPALLLFGIGIAVRRPRARATAA